MKCPVCRVPTYVVEYEKIELDICGECQGGRLVFLTGRELDSVEGAWEHDENAFEVVISRNEFDIAEGYDYVGIITRSDQPMWHNGEVKMLLRSTNEDGVFEGVWMTRNKSRRQMTFVVEHDNLIQASFVSTDGNTYFVRIRRIGPRFAATL